MKINYNYIKFSLLAVFMVTICSFSASRNKKRMISAPKVQFEGSNNLFITSEAVSNLLIQNINKAKNHTKEALDLNSLEQSLTSSPMISKAEVYVNTQGDLSAKVIQKQPIARVVAGAQYYLDSDGGTMPLSKNYTERVPLVTGEINKKKLDNIWKLATYVKNDSFLKKQVVEINEDDKNKLSIKIREANFNIQLGDLEHLDKKINNLKAFFIQASKENVLNQYKTVNLQFDNQVVCTKV